MDSIQLKNKRNDQKNRKNFLIIEWVSFLNKVTRHSSYYYFIVYSRVVQWICWLEFKYR